MRFFKKTYSVGQGHVWFAWYPVLAWWPGVADNPNDPDADMEKERFGWVWLENVTRRRNDSESLTKYWYEVINEDY